MTPFTTQNRQIGCFSQKPEHCILTSCWVCLSVCVCLLNRNGLGPSKEGEAQYSVVHCTGYIKAWPPAGKHKHTHARSSTTPNHPWWHELTKTIHFEDRCGQLWEYKTKIYSLTPFRAAFSDVFANFQWNTPIHSVRPVQKQSERERFMSVFLWVWQLLVFHPVFRLMNQTDNKSNACWNKKPLCQVSFLSNCTSLFFFL